LRLNILNTDQNAGLFSRAAIDQQHLSYSTKHKKVKTETKIKKTKQGASRNA